MKIPTETIPFDHPQAFQRALDVINTGGVIAFPTDTVYGIGVSTFQERAIEKIYGVKGRSHLKAIPILIGDLEDMDQVTNPLTPTLKKIVRNFWPGALTLVLPRLPSLPGNLSPSPTIGVRNPDHQLMRELLRITGALAATSANLSGEPSALTAEEVLTQLDGKIDLILDGGNSPGGFASTVLDCTGGEPKILREGPVTQEEIDRVVNG